MWGTSAREVRLQSAIEDARARFDALKPAVEKEGLYPALQARIKEAGDKQRLGRTDHFAAWATLHQYARGIVEQLALGIGAGTLGGLISIEFDEATWLSADELLARAVSFRLPVYRRLVRELAL